MQIVRDLNDIQNRVIAQDYEEHRKYLTNHSVTMKFILDKYKKYE